MLVLIPEDGNCVFGEAFSAAIDAKATHTLRDTPKIILTIG
jgi:hypothetical protein